MDSGGHCDEPAPPPTIGKQMSKINLNLSNFACFPELNQLLLIPPLITHFCVI